MPASRCASTSTCMAHVCLAPQIQERPYHVYTYYIMCITDFPCALNWRGLRKSTAVELYQLPMQGRSCSVLPREDVTDALLMKGNALLQLQQRVYAAVLCRPNHNPSRPWEPISRRSTFQAMLGSKIVAVLQGVHSQRL